jgi:hypothetical protein
MGSSDDGINVDPYLTYLDKEMTIMGILSGFCAAALALAIKLLCTKQLPTLIHDVMTSAPVCLSLGLMFLLLATLSFYRQRSLLAWYYGQIALEESGHSTGSTPREWLQDADGWDTWMQYQRGFLLLAGVIGEFLLAGIVVRLQSPCAGNDTSRLCSSTPDVWAGGIWALFVFIVLVVHKLILEKWPQSADPYEKFRDAPLSIFKRPKRSQR